MRQGGHGDIQLERFEEALHDPSAGLTYTALSGMRKQSVEDVERLFSESVVGWMEKMDMIMKQNIYVSSVIGGVLMMKEDCQLCSEANSIMIFSTTY